MLRPNILAKSMSSIFSCLREKVREHFSIRYEGNKKGIALISLIMLTAGNVLFGQTLKKKDLKDSHIRWTMEQVKRIDTSGLNVLEIKDSSLVHIGLKALHYSYFHLPEASQARVNTAFVVSHEKNKIVKVSHIDYAMYFHNDSLIYATAPCYQFVGWGYCNGYAEGLYQWYWKDETIYKTFSNQQDMDRCSCFLSEEPLFELQSLVMPIFRELIKPNE